ncbi:MAG TPA: hypothetical protein VGX25_09470 [Actinophytocola sp.]|uniref:hypothetical protein n=1 Tax=Actinophytocola sp. TaxID=1872138 RepID=UPI002DDD2B3E|nr:hypothetical protein [Actinophytocola sp.]HEV2779617.1 hypothetical protein [Actinophytocola sp.]
MATSLVAGSVVVGALAGTAPASAATGKNGVLEPGEIGFYRGFLAGPVFDLSTGDPDFSDDHFPGTAIPVAGNIDSVRNRDTRHWVAFTGRNFTGSQLCLAPRTAGTLAPGRDISSAIPGIC